MTFAQPFSGYEILERLGAGAMGTVFKARDKKLQRDVALKVLKPSLARNERYVERLGREARIAASLNHPNIVTGYDLGEEGGYHFFVMEFVEGRSLRSLLSEWGMFPEPQVLDVAIQVASALDHAHQIDVIHRDIKPGNILITDDNVVKLTDMGLAKGPTDLTITRDGATVGTPQYISPEQARDPQAADIRSDLYSLGATLYHMLTGSPPFVGETFAEVLNKVLHQRAPSATELNPAVSDGLSLVIRKLLAKDPDVRYQTPAELLDDLRRVERAEAPEVDLKRLSQEGERRRAAPWLLWSAVGLLAIGGVYLVTAGGGVDAGRDAAESVRDLANRLAQSDSIGARLRAVRQAELSAAEKDRSVIAGMRLAAEDELRRVVDELADSFVIGSRLDEMTRWFQQPAHWRDPAGFEREVLGPALRDAVGVRPEELPTALRTEVMATVARVRARADEVIERRDAAFRERFSTHLGEIGAGWRGPLDQNRFEEARSVFDRSLGAFFSRSGHPTREQLPDELRGWIDAREAEVRAQVGAEIDQRERSLAGDLEQRVGQAISDLEARRRTSSAASSWERLDELRRDLSRFHTGMFQADVDPLPGLQKSLDELARRIAGDRQFEEAEKLDRAVALAYRTLLLTGEPAEAWAWLEPLRFEDDQFAALRDRHVRVLRAAGIASEAVCDALLRDRQRIGIEVRAGREGPVERVELVRAADGFAWLDSGGRPIAPTPSAIHWPDLFATAWPDGAVTDGVELPIGLALWRLACGERVDGADDFLADSVAPAIARASRAIADPSRSAAELLSLLRDELAKPARDLEAIAGALRGIRTQFGGGELSPDDAAVVDEAEGWLRSARERLALLDRMRALVPRDVEVDVVEGRRVELGHSPAVLAAAGLPTDWELEGRVLRFDGLDADLGEQLGDEGGLVWPTHLGDASTLHAEFRLRFPALPDRLRVYVFELRGAALVCGLLRDGSVAAVVAPIEELRRDAEVRRSLRARLEAVLARSQVKLVADASYRLVLTWSVAKRRIRLDCAIDGTTIATRAWNSSRPSPDRVRVAPLQPLWLEGVTLRADL